MVDARKRVAQVPAGEELGGPITPVPGSDYGFGVYTQYGMLANVAALIAPVLALMKQRVVSGNVLGVDDTSVRLQDPSLPGKMRTARFWLYRGRDDHPYNVFDFTENRGRDGPCRISIGLSRSRGRSMHPEADDSAAAGTSPTGARSARLSVGPKRKMPSAVSVWWASPACTDPLEFDRRRQYPWAE